MKKFFKCNVKVIITSLAFILVILFMTSLTITTKNILDFSYSIFLVLGFCQYLLIKKAD
ncbi:MAG: hypothetical protein RSB99_00805 [Bacilli bacterium]